MSRVLRWIAAAGAVLLTLLAALTRRDRATAARAVAEDRRVAAADTLERIDAGQAEARGARQLQAEGRTAEEGVAARDAAWGRK